MALPDVFRRGEKSIFALTWISATVPGHLSSTFPYPSLSYKSYGCPEEIVHQPSKIFRICGGRLQFLRWVRLRFPVGTRGFHPPPGATGSRGGAIHVCRQALRGNDQVNVERPVSQQNRDYLQMGTAPAAACVCILSIALPCESDMLLGLRPSLGGSECD
jgi:hypothetical protein